MFPKKSDRPKFASILFMYTCHDSEMKITDPETNIAIKETFCHMYIPQRYVYCSSRAAKWYLFLLTDLAQSVLLCGLVVNRNICSQSIDILLKVTWRMSQWSVFRWPWWRHRSCGRSRRRERDVASRELPLRELLQRRLAAAQHTGASTSGCGIATGLRGLRWRSTNGHLAGRSSLPVRRRVARQRSAPSSRQSHSPSTYTSRTRHVHVHVQLTVVITYATGPVHLSLSL